METIRADLDWLRDYAAVLERHGDRVGGVKSSLTAHELADDAFGEVGQSLQTPQAYRRAAESLLGQLDRAEEVLTASATALRQAAEHYQSTDADGAQVMVTQVMVNRAGGSDAAS